MKGEPDASSFPSGGLRATAEARGYTAWDPTSYAFVKDERAVHPHRVLLLYRRGAGQKDAAAALAWRPSARRRCRILQPVRQQRVHSASTTTVGPEQEYFLVDREQYLPARGPASVPAARCSARCPPRGRSWTTTTSASSSPAFQAYMKELDEELWKLGVSAKTKHNEVAPAQHELAPIFSTTNIAVDHNQLTMEMMKQRCRQARPGLPAA